jgi:hypothetical protein
LVALAQARVRTEKVIQIAVRINAANLTHSASACRIAKVLERFALAPLGAEGLHRS